MGKPRTPVGTFGTIGFRTRDDGRVAASTRYRDWDGKLRRVQATAGRGLPPGAEGALCHASCLRFGGPSRGPAAQPHGSCPEAASSAVDTDGAECR